MVEHLKGTNPVRHLDASDEHEVEGWDGEGWYWIDPAWRAGHYFGHPRVTGPFDSRDLALSEYWAYCEAMTI